jgi:hypothetical protein
MVQRFRRGLGVRLPKCIKRLQLPALQPPASAPPQ